MEFHDLKITCVKAEGNCSRTRPGDTFYIKNLKVVMPEGISICLFALNSILPVLSAAVFKTQKDHGVLDLLEEWQCPDPLAEVIFKIEPLKE